MMEDERITQALPSLVILVAAPQDGGASAKHLSPLTC
jgi:hypothetical protein